MKTYYFEMAGIGIRLDSKREISVTDKWNPFLCETVPEKIKYEISAEECGTLPHRPLDGIKKEFVLYCKEPKTINFHYELSEDEPYASTVIEDDGKITLNYLSKSATFFESTSGIFKHIGIELLLNMQNGLLMHSSFVKYKEKAILFSAPSGTGKSTQADLWKCYRGADVINGDRAALVKDEDAWRAWGIPYAGRSGIYRNESAPVGALIVLRQGKENCIQKIGGLEAFRCLYPELNVHHWDVDYVNRGTLQLQKLISEVPIFLMECLPDESAVEFLHHKLQEEAILC